MPLRLFLFLLLALRATAQPTPIPPVIDWKAPATLSTYLLQQVQVQYAARQLAVDKALTTGIGTAAYRDSAQARFRRVLGVLPARTPLRARVVGIVPQAGFSIEKIVYESQPHHRVTANLYVPLGSGRRPAALLFCGHENAAKATPSYQLTARLLARNGFVVLVIDPVSQGERMQLLDASGKPLTRGGTTEHTLLNAEATLLGRTLPGEELWDNVRGLDYLLTRPEVDAARVACLGNSGGATQAAYFAAYETQRVAAVALCSYVAAGARNLTLTGPADGCVMLPGAGAAHLDVADWLVMAAPRPLLLLTGRYDFVDQTDMEAAWAEAHRVYATLGVPDQLGLFTYDDGHGISAPKRAAAVQWLRRWLVVPGEFQLETSLAVLPEATLRCTATGQVGTTFKDEQSLADLHRAALLAAQAGPPRRGHRLAALADTGAMAPHAEIRDTLRRPDGQQWQGLLVRRPGQPPLPARRLLPLPGAPAPTRLLLWLPDQGLAATLRDSAARLAAYQHQGVAVLLADLRGLGETTDPAAFNDPKYYNQEYRVALLALHLGQPLPSQRATDVATLLAYVHRQPALAPLPLSLRADGRAGLPALLTGTPGAGSGLPAVSGIPAFGYWLENPAAHDAYSWVLPGMLVSNFAPAPGSPSAATGHR